MLATGYSCRCTRAIFQAWLSIVERVASVAVGGTTHRRDDLSRIARVNHQSEVIRPAGCARRARPRSSSRSSKANRRAERFLAGFIGAAHQLTTITVRTPNLDDGARDARRSGTAAFGRGPRNRAARILAFGRGLGRGWLCGSREMLGDTMDARDERAVPARMVFLVPLFSRRSPKTRCAPTCARSKELRAEFPLEVVQLDDGYPVRARRLGSHQCEISQRPEKARRRNSCGRFHRRESGPRRFWPRAIRSSCASIRRLVHQT